MVRQRTSPISLVIKRWISENRQSTKLFLQSSELGPHSDPLTRRRVFPEGGGGYTVHTRSGKGGGGPNSYEGTDDTVVLQEYMYFVMRMFGREITCNRLGPTPPSAVESSRLPDGGVGLHPVYQ